MKLLRVSFTATLLKTFRRHMLPNAVSPPPNVMIRGFAASGNLQSESEKANSVSSNAAIQVNDDGGKPVEIYVHTDATYKETTGKGCVAGVLRDNTGKLLLCFYMKIGENEKLRGQGGSTKAKAISVRYGQVVSKWWAKEKEYSSPKKLHIKGFTDSLNVHKLFVGESQGDVLNDFIKKLKKKGNDFGSYELERIPKEEIESSDALADYGNIQEVKEGKWVYLEKPPNEEIKTILEKEKDFPLFKKQP